LILRHFSNLEALWQSEGQGFDPPQLHHFLVKRGSHLPRFVRFWTNTQLCARVSCGVTLVTAESGWAERPLIEDS